MFLSLDFFLFYVFWEVMLLPMYFLIGIWGGPRKEYAAIKFFLYTLVGSVGLLIVLVGMYLLLSNTGQGTFDLIRMASPDDAGRYSSLSRAPSARMPGDLLPAVDARLPHQGAGRSRSTRGCLTPTSRLRRRSP